MLMLFTFVFRFYSRNDYLPINIILISPNCGMNRPFEGMKFSHSLFLARSLSLPLDECVFLAISLKSCAHKEWKKCRIQRKNNGSFISISIRVRVREWNKGEWVVEGNSRWRNKKNIPSFRAGETVDYCWKMRRMKTQNTIESVYSLSVSLYFFGKFSFS